MGQRGEYQLNLADAIAAGADALDRLPPGELGPFSRTSWFCLLADALPPGEQAHAFKAARNGATQWWVLRGTANIRRLQSLSNWYSFGWRPETVGDTALTAALAEDVARQLLAIASRLDLSPVRDGDRTWLTPALRRAGWLVDAATTSANHRLVIGDQGFDAWWATRPGRLRSTVKRKGRDLGAAIRIERSFRDADWRAFEDVYGASWKVAEGQPDLLRAFAKHEADAGRMRLGLLTHEGEVIAAQFWTMERTRAFIHKLAHRPDHDRRSPGTLLTHALVAACVADGAREIDFGTGDDPYKHDWSDRVDPLHHIVALNPRRPAAWPAIAKVAARKVLRSRPGAALASGAPVG